MAEHRDARLDVRMLCDVVADVLSLGRALGDDDEDVAFAVLVCVGEVVDDLREVKFLLGDEDVLRTARDARDESEPAGATPHDLEHDDAPMRRCCVAQLVDRVDDRIRRRVAADRIVHAPDIVVNRARQADDGKAKLLGEQLCAAQRTVAADHAEPLDAALDEVLMSAAASLGRRPLLAARRPEEGAAALDDVAHILGLKLPHILIEESLIAIVDAPHTDAFIEGCARHGTRRRVHSGAVSPARHDCNTL